MPPISHQQVQQTLRTVCEVIHAAASFTRPTVTPLQDGSPAVSLWINVQVNAVVTTDGHYWYLHEITNDISTGEQHYRGPIKLAEKQISPQQAGTAAVSYVINYLTAAVQQTKQALDSILACMEAG